MGKYEFLTNQSTDITSQHTSLEWTKYLSVVEMSIHRHTGMSSLHTLSSTSAAPHPTLPLSAFPIFALVRCQGLGRVGLASE
jgi:hypothetical protein